ncbi:malic enzyme-like NAD(P)-binding protein [Thermovirga sp.]|uniref:NAD(P)-dependent malic enzyme n=1 Tax=Thermovirga sp. TaxID=2699834 RepID=UPI0025D70983|nr:malic enzyme-like NAD(P)-binding protein [Thermovirga sp.]MBO8154510.1 NAD-dependent malic enzyme [Thermovirga sp.]
MNNKESVYEKSLKLHKQFKGKISVESKMPVETMDDLSLVYTPGVAEPCREIERNPSSIFEVTSKGNMVAVVTDGTAVLGLGDIGPDAALPVMEGKAVLFKRFAGIDAFPICVDSKDPDEIVDIVSKIASSFGGINLEDISAPRCFEIERKLQEKLEIPVFHDDQHGTAVIALAGLFNALKIVGKKIEDVKVVMSGAGAAGVAISKFLLSAGAKNVILCDRAGAIYDGRPEHMNPAKEDIARNTNPEKESGSLEDVIRGADVFMGISGPGLVTKGMVRSMAKNPVIFAMANPTPEIFPDEAKAAGAAVVATGRSDFPNQINNCLGFPGIFRGALDVRAKAINEEMKLAATKALADLVSGEELSPEYIIPSALDPRVVPAVAKAVAEAACNSGVARLPL